LITTKYSYKELNHRGKKIRLLKNVRQYTISNSELKLKKQNEKEKYLYAYKFFGIEYRKKLIEKLCTKYEFNENELAYLATYLLECDKDKSILTSKQIKGINRFEIPFEFSLDDEYEDEKIDNLNDNLAEFSQKNIIYHEKSTKLYKISQLSYTSPKWEIVDIKNFFTYKKRKFLIMDKHTEYNVKHDNLCDMDKVFCTTNKNGDYEFYNQKIEPICVIPIH